MQMTDKSIRMRIYNATQDSEFRNKCSWRVMDEGKTLRIICPVRVGQIIRTNIPLTKGWEEDFKVKIKKLYLRCKQSVVH